MSLPSKNAAGHEAFHFWGSTQAREGYANEVADNLNFSSKEFVEYQAVIAEAYLGGEADLSDSTQLQKIREELLAYISGDIYEGVNDDLLRPMFRDYDAVKAAWVKLCKDRAENKVQSSMRDSAGRELTEAQQAYFKDSKVRDADGNLLVMYHQTDGTFTVFDTKHKGAGAGDDETPFGIFLKRTSRNIGVRGEKQMELYADIRNPLRVHDRTELVSKLRELSVDYARLKDESAKIDKEYGAKFEEAKNAFKSFLIQWRKNNPDAPPRAAYDADGFDAAFNAEDNVVKEWTRAKDELALRAKTSITQALRDNGYDGVILENDKGSWGRSTDAYIALDANQVKNTTNKTPTADPDIRYQQRDPRLSDRDVLHMAADMAQRDRSQRWSVDDLNRFDLLQRKLQQLDEANAELEALKEERKVLLAGRKVKELTREEQFDLAQNRNRTETQKGKMFVNRIQRVARNNIS